jgi:hypothetical protein
MPKRREHHGKGKELGQDIAEEESELTLQPAPNHERNDPCLEQGMRDPETIIKNPDFLTHQLGCLGFDLP